MKFRLLEDNVLIVCDPEMDKVGKIYLPETHSERSKLATVIEAGPGIKNHKGEFVPMALKVGDRVAIRWHSGDHLHFPGKTVLINGKPEEIDEIRFRIIRATEALAVIEEE